MDRKEIILASLAPASCDSYSPVQLQKLLFLIDRNIREDLDGTDFDFQPYNYGPFDKSIYHTMEELEREGLVSISWQGSWNSYRLTDKGQREGQSLLNRMDKEVSGYIIKASEFVRKLSFSELVSAIYTAYPEMRENSVFQD